MGKTQFTRITDRDLIMDCINRNVLFESQTTTTLYFWARTDET